METRAKKIADALIRLGHPDVSPERIMLRLDELVTQLDTLDDEKFCKLIEEHAILVAALSLHLEQFDEERQEEEE